MTRADSLAVSTETIVPLPMIRSIIPPVTKIRSTWIAASVASLRKQGLFERYEPHLPREHRDAIVLAVAGTWMPVEMGIIHYRACDAMGLSRGETIERGQAVSGAIQSSLLDVVARAAKGVGVTPWTVFEQYPRIFSRIFVGGATGVRKLGPKEARIEFAGIPFARFDYFRYGLRGVVLDVGSRFCTKAYCTEVADRCTDQVTTYAYSWA
jgi:hypothetical protein